MRWLRLAFHSRWGAGRSSKRGHCDARKNPHGLFVTVSNRLEQKSGWCSRHGDVARRDARPHWTLV